MDSNFASITPASQARPLDLAVTLAAQSNVTWR